MGGHHTLLKPTSVPFQAMLRSAVYTTHIPCYHRCALPGFKDLISILSLYSDDEALCVAISLPAAVVDPSPQACAFMGLNLGFSSYGS